MSEDEGVMLLDAVVDIAPRQVTPVAGKGALGTWQVRRRSGARAQIRGKPFHSTDGATAPANRWCVGWTRASA